LNKLYFPLDTRGFLPLAVPINPLQFERFGSPIRVVTFEAHSDDVNKVDWNPLHPNLIWSGSDSRLVTLWDMRAMSISVDTREAAAEIKLHSETITSIAWNPYDKSEFALACKDVRVTIWDQLVEPTHVYERENRTPDQIDVIGIAGLDAFIPDRGNAE
jgi:WD40 repeat protein